MRRVIIIVVVLIVILALTLLVGYGRPRADNSEQTEFEPATTIEPIAPSIEQVTLCSPTPVISSPVPIEEPIEDPIDPQYTIDEYMQRQEYAHDMAENARKLGLDEEHIVIQTARDIWWDAQRNIEYLRSQQWWTDYELDLMAAVIWYEAGSNDCSDRHQQLVGQVVLNRVNDDRFPDTIYDVLTQKSQYSTIKMILKNAGNRDIIPQRCYDNALVALRGEVECPDNVVFQANFRQGTGIYETHYTSYSVSYFCYG